MISFREYLNESDNQLTESVPAVLQPTIGIGKEGSVSYMQVLDSDEVDGWISKYGKNLVNITSTQLSKIQNRLTTAQSQDMGPRSITFTGYKGKLYIVSELSKPGMTRSATLLDPITGKTVTVNNINDFENPPINTLLGIKKVINISMGQIGRVRLEVAALEFEGQSNGNRNLTPTIVTQYLDLDNGEALSVASLKDVYSKHS